VFDLVVEVVHGISGVVVEIKTKSGKAREVCNTVHDKILSTLKAQPGFIDEMVLVSDTEDGSCGPRQSQRTVRLCTVVYAGCRYDPLRLVYPEITTS